MQYIGPDYDESFGIVLPGLATTLYPRLLIDSEITKLLLLFPHLASYFDVGNNNNTVTNVVVTTTTGGDKHYLHNQGTASEIWNITHNLGKYPSVTIVDSGGSAVIGEVKYTSINSVRLEFDTAFGGVAYCN